MKKEYLKYVLVSIIMGIILGKFVYSEYENNTKEVFNYDNEYVYLLQYGVYSSKESMIENTKILSNYFYYIEEDKYHVLIGITKNEDLKQKIVDSYKITDNIYMKKVKVDNMEFLNSLTQYDNLIENTDDVDTILSSEKQILSKYEELVLNSE